jgi:hypothetical protein
MQPASAAVWGPARNRPDRALRFGGIFVGLERPPLAAANDAARLARTRRGASTGTQLNRGAARISSAG